MAFAKKKTPNIAFGHVLTSEPAEIGKVASLGLQRAEEIRNHLGILDILACASPKEQQHCVRPIEKVKGDITVRRSPSHPEGNVAFDKRIDIRVNNVNPLFVGYTTVNPLRMFTELRKGL